MAKIRGWFLLALYTTLLTTLLMLSTAWAQTPGKLCSDLLLNQAVFSGSARLDKNQSNLIASNLILDLLVFKPSTPQQINAALQVYASSQKLIELPELNLLLGSKQQSAPFEQFYIALTSKDPSRSALQIEKNVNELEQSINDAMFLLGEYGLITISGFNQMSAKFIFHTSAEFLQRYILYVCNNARTNFDQSINDNLLKHLNRMSLARRNKFLTKVVNTGLAIARHLDLQQTSEAQGLAQELLTIGMQHGE